MSRYGENVVDRPPVRSATPKFEQLAPELAASSTTVSLVDFECIRPSSTSDCWLACKPLLAL